MLHPRAGHAATRLIDGRVLVTGDTQPPEIYDPATATWTETAPMITPHDGGFTATVLDNGQVLVAGGTSDGGTNAAELFNPQSGTWITTGYMSAGRQYHTATRLTNGKVLVTGGLTSAALASAELYDPATGTWSPTGSMLRARQSHTATRLKSGMVLVVGGRPGVQGKLAAVELYNPATGLWTNTGHLNRPQFGHRAVLLRDGRVLIVGGGETPEMYDPASARWTQMVDTNVGSSGWGATLTLLSNGQALVTGGNSYKTEGTSGTYLFDPNTETWRVGPPMQMRRIAHTATPLPDGRVLVAGGRKFTRSMPNAATEIYQLPDQDLGIGLFDSPDPAQLGDIITYRIVVVQNGRMHATHTVMTDALPNTMTLISATASQGNCTGTTTISCSIGTVASGAPVTITIKARATSNNVVATNTTSVSSDGTDEYPDNNSASTSTLIGNRPPDATAPVATLQRGQQATATTAPVQLTWTAQDTDGISRYEVQRSTNGGAFTTVKTVTTTALQGMARLQLASGKTYQFRVRATDGAGVTGDWAAATPLVFRIDDDTSSAVLDTGQWTTSGLSGSYGGGVQFATTPGTAVSYTFTGTSVAVIGARGPNRGKIDVLLNGQHVAVMDLYKATVSPGTSVYAIANLSYQEWTIEVRIRADRNAASTGTRIDIDAFMALGPAN